MAMKLYGYFRSSAAFRVRIALNLKKLEYETAPIHLRRNDQTKPDYLAVNPQIRTVVRPLELQVNVPPSPSNGPGPVVHPLITDAAAQLLTTVVDP